MIKTPPGPGRINVVTNWVEELKARVPVDDGKMISAETTTLNINKSGFQWQINYYAHSQPEIYGIAAILVALFAGWIAAVASPLF